MTGDDYVDAMSQLSLACRLLLNLDDRLDDCLRGKPVPTHRLALAAPASELAVIAAAFRGRR